MEGRRALNAEIVVRVHGREPELWSIGRMADCLSAGTGSIPVSSAISLREIRLAAKTLASRSSNEGSSPSSPAIASMQQEVDELRIDDTRCFKLIGEQWFVVTYQVVEVGRYERPRTAWDVVQRTQVQLTWGRCHIAINKRQCNREEVRSIHKRIAQWRQYLRKM